jgi:hypothetical protein
MEHDAKTSEISWWPFVRRCFAVAYKMAVDTFSKARASCAVVAAVCALGFSDSFFEHRGWKVSKWFIEIPFGVAVFVFLYNFLRSPFYVCKEIEKTGKTEIEAQKKRVGELVQELEHTKSLIVREEHKIAERTAILTKIGGYQHELDRRFSEIRRMDYWDFANQNATSFESKVMDLDTHNLIAEIGNYLDSVFPGSSADFKDTIGLQYSPVIPVVELIAGKQRYWQGTLDHLKHRAANLAKVKDKYIMANRI